MNHTVMNPSCLFCKIIQKEIPSIAVYESDDVYAFLDIHPVHPGHTLVVPKQHCEGVLTCDPAVLSEVARAAKYVAHAVTSGLGVSGFNLIQNEGAVAGQVIPHLHIHVIPRVQGDGLTHWPGTPYPNPEAMTAVAEKIRGAF